MKKGLLAAIIGLLWAFVIPTSELPVRPRDAERKPQPPALCYAIKMTNGPVRQSKYLRYEAKDSPIEEAHVVLDCMTLSQRVGDDGHETDVDYFDLLPPHIQHLGPWTGSHEGDVADLRTRYRLLLMTEGFVVVHRRVVQFQPEVETRKHVARKF